MGKYIRKAKITGDVAVMEVVSQSSLGVRTRAKTLALQRLQSTNTPPPTMTKNPESSYLQLRSRRLEKFPPLLDDTKKQQQSTRCGKNPHSANPSSRTSSRLSIGSVSISCSKNEERVTLDFTIRGSKDHETEDNNDLGIEPSFGENNLDFDGIERGTRESTPCSLIRESDAAGTPGSTTRQRVSTATNRRIRNAMQRNIPTSREMEEFFACAEQHQQRLFIDKYNFDIGNDLPLPGRYEWVRVNQ